MLTLSSKRILFAFCLLLSLCTFQETILATGIQDVAPTAADAPVMLEAGRPGFGTFAEFDGPADGRLVVSIRDASEVLYIGLAPEYRDNGNPFSSDNFSRYRFRIRQITEDGTNPIVHGPFTIDNDNANVNSYEEAEFGVYELGNMQFGDSIYVFRPDAAGDYSIEFDEFTNDGSNRVTIPFWDFTVIRNGAPVEGRLWSRGWAFRTPQVNGDIEPDCVWDRQFNGELYSYTEDGFVSRIDFNNSGLQGLSFNIAFNDRGPGQSGDIAADRQSVPGVNATDDAAQHRIFLQLPDINLFPDGICGEIQTAETFTCGGVDPYCLDIEVTRPGQVDILLDFNGNGILDDNSQDVALVYEFTEGDLATCVPWNGLRGDSTPVTFTDTVDVIVNYSQGVQHWSAYDVEFMRNGFCVETVRPICAQTISSDQLYWDDRNIPQDPGTGAPKDNRSGNGCLDVPRTWDFFELNSGQCDNFDDALTEGYGDKNTLNTWWFANSQAEFRARVPVVSAVITGPTNFCSGDTSTLVAMDPAITGSMTFDWSGPGVDTATTSSVRVYESGVYCVSITDELGCSNETCVTVTVFEFDADQFPEDLAICFGDSVQMPVAGDPAFTYSWTPSTGISSTTSNQPTFNPTETTTYIATISGASTTGEICEITEEITIEVYPEIGLQVIGGGPICDPTTTITATTLNPATVELFGPDGSLIDTGNEFTLPVSGEANYTIVATDVQGCVDSANFLVSGGPVDISVPDSVLACLSDGVPLSVTNLDQNDTLTYTWAPAELFTPESVNTAAPVFAGPQGDYNVTVTVENQYGCTAEENIQLIVIDDAGVLSFEPEIDCDGRTVTFNNTSTVSFGYIYDFGDGNTSMEASPTHVYQTSGTFTVTLDLIYDQTCVASFTQEVTTFETLIDADFSIDFGNCDNGSATLTFTDESINQTGETLTYDWTFTGVDPAASDVANPVVTVTESGTVSANLEISVAGCSASIDTTFTVELAVVNLAEEITICPGETTELNPGGNPDLIYSWSPAPDFDPNAVNPTTGTAGTYIVTVTSNSADYNCENTDTVTVIIPDSIGLVVSGPDGPINTNGGPGMIDLATVQTCGTPIDITTEIMVNDGATITFTDLEGNVLGMGNTLSVNPDTRDTVVITATNEFGCVERDTVVIVNNQVDAGINVGTDGITVCSATDTMVTVINFDPADTLTYAWEPNTIINGPLDGPTVDITSPIEGLIELSVTVTNQFGCDSMLLVPVEVIPFVPNIYPDTIRPCFGDPFTIEGGPALAGYTYDWSPSDNLDLSDPANPVGTFTEDVTLEVLITNTLTGCSGMQRIFVDTAPEIAFSVAPASTDICGTGIVTITGTSVNDNVEITWYNDEALTDVAGAGSTIDIDANMMGETFTVYGQALDPTTGCSQVLPATVNSLVFTPNDFPEMVTPCFGEQITITGGDAVAGYTYEWMPAGILDETDPANPTGVFTEDVELVVTITDPVTGCSINDTIMVDTAPEISFGVDPPETNICGTGIVTIFGTTVNDDVVITWYNDPELTDSAGTGPSFVINADMMGQSYTIYGEAVDTITGCSQSLPATVNTTAFMPNQYPPVIMPCFGDEFTIVGGDIVAGYVYEWNPSDNLDLTDPANPVGIFTEDGIISVTITDPATNCTETQNITVEVAPEISFMTSPADTTLCEPGMVTITGTSVNDDVDIVWYDDEALTTEIGQGATIVVDAAEPGQTYTVYGVATDPNTECRQVVPATVTVSELTAGLPLASIDACAGERPAIFGDNGPSGNLEYEYSPADVVDDSDPLNPVFSGDASTEITVTVTDPATGCSVMTTISVNITDITDLTGIATPDEIFVGDNSELTVLGCDDCEYEWFPQDGTVSPTTGATVIATPEEPGTYTYEVDVTQNGCMETVLIELRVEDPICDADRIFVPNAFTPNGDNMNDVLRVRSSFAELLTEFRFIIYNRWGQEVYTSTDINESWDGTTEGDDLEPDVYGYWLRVRCPSGEELIQKGNITIQR